MDLSKVFPGLDFHASIYGHDAGLNSNEQLVRWEVPDQKVDKYVPSFDATIDRIKGQFITAFTPIDPAQQMISCKGANRYYGAYFETTGPDNGFTLTLRKTVAGIDHDGTVTVSNFFVNGLVGNPLDLAVRIHVPQGCGHQVFEGGTATAFAIASGVPQGTIGVTERYEWTIEGGVPIPPTDQWKITFTTPTTEPVYVSVTVTALDQTAFDTTKLIVNSLQLASLLELMCKLREIITHLFPRRDFRLKPLTPDEIRGVARLAEEITEIAHQIRTHTRLLSSAE